MHFCQGGRAPFSPEGMRENSDVKKEVYSFVYPLSALHISMYWVRSHERVRAELLEFCRWLPAVPVVLPRALVLHDRKLT